jgi:hypothetical protein
MKPIGLTQKYSNKKYAAHTGGEMMLVHLCLECEKLSINRIAADDVSEAILEVFRGSFLISERIQNRIISDNIDLLRASDGNLVNKQLLGTY